MRAYLRNVTACIIESAIGVVRSPRWRGVCLPISAPVPKGEGQDVPYKGVVLSHNRNSQVMNIISRGEINNQDLIIIIITNL